MIDFPYPPREPQREMMRDIEEVLNGGGHIVIEAPTGFGKTIASLYPAVRYAIRNSKKILYLVRTNSQERKVIEEAKHLGVLAVGMQGRAHMCPLARERDELRYGNAEELSLLCGKLKKDVRDGEESACEFFSNYLKDPEILLDYIREGHTSEEIFNRGYSLRICPYEAIKDAMKDAIIVTLPYIYFLAPFLRDVILEKMGVSLRDIILVVDEAHNFPEFARELRSDTLSEESLERMEKECQDYRDPFIQGHRCSDVAEYLKEAIYKLEEYVEDEEGIAPQYALEENIADLMGIPLNRVQNVASDLVNLGLMIREERMRRRKIPRSYIYHAGNFLMYWRETYSYEYLHLVKLGENPRLEVFCLDPSSITDMVRNVHSSIHMSGTLSLGDYRDLVNLPEDTLLRRYPSPFPRENLLILYVDDVSTKYGELEKNLERIATYVKEIMDLRRNTAVFFPSYSVLQGVLSLVDREVIVEERGLRQSSLTERIDKFRKEGGAIFSVLGGRIAEGLDFPGKELEIVVIAGIPYPKPTPRQRMLQQYYEYKFGRGWELAFKMPASIKMRQAIGRLIRKETDRGVAVILDRRIVRFHEEIPARITKNLKEDIEKFFQNDGKRGGGASS